MKCLLQISIRDWKVRTKCEKGTENKNILDLYYENSNSFLGLCRWRWRGTAQNLYTFIIFNILFF